MVAAAAAANCDTCHRGGFTIWAGGRLHANVTITAGCVTCHTLTPAGSFLGAIGKPADATHAAVTGNCESCHKSTTSFPGGVAFARTTVHAAGATQPCKTCHGGSVGSQGARAKPANHIPEVQLLAGATLDCKACHTSTTTFTAVRMNHNNSQGNGAGACKACHATGTAYLGDMQRMALSHRSKTATDCSQSGCHRPLGNRGHTYRSWD
jgi:hypothetical protein